MMHIIRNTLVSAFAEGDILQVLFVALLFGFALFAPRATRQAAAGHHRPDRACLFKIVGIVMKVAPIGAFGAMAFTIGNYGVGTLLPLGAVDARLLCHLPDLHLPRAWHRGAFVRLQHLSSFIRYIKEELLIVLGTSSSESALPRMIAKIENLGCQKSVVGLVIPTGYSFNLDGTCIYLTMAAIFLAQATNTDLSLSQEIGVLAVLLLTSKGAAGVTGSGFIVLAATLASVGTIPVASIALILGVDRFMSEARL